MYQRPVNQAGYPQSSVRMALFSQKNQDNLINNLTADIQSRTGHLLSPKQQERLEKAVDHYTKEVYSTQGDKPLAVLNREIARVTNDDFSKYFQRQEAVRTQPANPVKTIANDTLFQDISTRFERLQTDRQEVKALPPPAPDFRVSLDDEGPSSVDLFEKAKRMREQEALRIANSSKDAMDRIDPGLARRNAADDSFRSQQSMANRATELNIIERQNQPRSLDMPLIVPPDRRELMLSTNVTIDPTGTPRDLGQANSNPTITYPQLQSPQKANLQQDILIRQEDVISYKEIENNVFVNSADRNWLSANTKENRYNFSVLFSQSNLGKGFGPIPQVEEKFKNIVRIELVKAILPVEGLNTLIASDASENNTAYQINVLSLPYVTINIPELDTNNYGTFNIIDRSFAVIQYDATWYSDPNTTTDSRGYTAFIPKFLKCQKVYEPTPLATLQKMTINILRPNGVPLAETTDALDIDRIFGAGIPWATGSKYDLVDGSGYPKYFFIKTSTFFSRFQFAVGDNIEVANYIYGQDILGTFDGVRAFVNWINKPDGHFIVGIGYTDGATTTDGPNSVGYANVLIVDARYFDPTTGSTSIDPFGGSINSDLEFADYCLATPRRLINVSRQVQLVFRVVTRELDPVAQLRPDNM